MNGKKPDRLIFFILNALILTLMLSTASARTAAGADLVILYSNDIRGETEPCG